jgi:hypothetical protein
MTRFTTRRPGFAAAGRIRQAVSCFAARYEPDLSPRSHEGVAAAGTVSALKSFERFLSLLAAIPDPRRAEGKLYQLPHVLLFSILAIVSGANSYRGICTFIKIHRRKPS